MSQAGILIEFDSKCDLSDQQCRGRTFEIRPTSDVVGGSRVYFNAYAVQRTMLENLTVQLGSRLLSDSGIGFHGPYNGIYEAPGRRYSEPLSFNGEDKVQLKYPICTAVETWGSTGEGRVIVLAESSLMWVEPKSGKFQQFAARGENVTDKMHKIGFSCIGPKVIIDEDGGEEIVVDEIQLWGSVVVRYPVAKWMRTWIWDVWGRARGQYIAYLLEHDLPVLTHVFDIPLPAADEEEDYINRQRQRITPVDVIVAVREYASESPVEGATVWIDGVLKGVTDEVGTISVGILTEGRHTIVIKKAGYVDSDVDDIENDSFVIGFE